MCPRNYSVGKLDCLIIVAVLALSVVVYCNSLQNSFVWDDEALVVDNSSIRSLRNVPALFVTRLFPEIKGGNFYRPVQSLSYAIDYFFWGLKPFGYHLTNLFLHTANAVLVYFILFVLTGRRNISFMTSLLFVVHPIQTEAVDYISGRADLLAALFMYISLLCFLLLIGVQRRDTPYNPKKVSLYIAAMGSFIIALLTKEAMAVFPLIILLCSFCSEAKRQGIPIGEKQQSTDRTWPLCALPFFIVAVYLSIRIVVCFSGREVLSSNPYPLYNRFLTSFKVILFYIKLLIVPFPLHMERVIPMETSFSSVGVIVPMAIIIGIGVAAIEAYRHSKVAFLGIAWFFIALLPYMNWFPLNAEMAEHWLYVPSVGFFLLVALGIERVGLFLPSRLVILIFIAILVSLSSLTIKRNIDWRDNETIYAQTARYSSGSPRAHYNLGNIYLEKGRFEKAIREYRESARIKMGDAKVHKNLGKALLALGRHQEGIREFESAVSLEPSSADAHIKLGAAYGLAGLNKKAIGALKTAIALDPNQAEAHNNLASVYTNMGKFQEAEVEYARALRVKPDMVEANFNLGIVYYNLGQREKAVKQFDKVLVMKPNFGRAVIWKKKAMENNL